MTGELLYQIALTRVPNIGDIHAKALMQIFPEASAVFKAPRKQLEAIEGIGPIKAAFIKKFNDFSICEEEMAFMEKYKIRPLFLTDKDYPQRLLNCYDCPTILYYRGNANLNHDKIISVVGTRNYTEYGKQTCEQFVAALENEHVLVVSGLAFGIDTIAHKTALKHGLPTIGVLAHGLDRIYPPQNKSLAKEMTSQGGLLTDFMSNSKPDKQNFPKRNRIVAGICDALLVVESGKKGGSLITAELANGYNKDVFAIPGKITDSKSEGCNFLVKNNKASMVTCADDLLQMMNWDTPGKKIIKQQRELFIELTPDEKTVVDLLNAHDTLGIDDLRNKTALSSSNLAVALLSLEMQNILSSLPGKIYKLI